MCVPMLCICTCECRFLWRPEEGLRFPWSWSTRSGSGKPPNMDARNQTREPLQEQCKLWVAEPSLQPYEILNEEGNKVKEINKVKNEFVKGKTAGR